VRAGQTPLVIIGVLNAVISVFYYLRVVVVMYMNEPEAELPHEPTSIFTAAALIVCAVAVFLIGIMPSTIIEAVQHSVFQLPH